MNLIILTVLVAAAAAAPGQAPKQQAPAAGTVRIAVVNIGYVFNHYDKAVHFKKELEATLHPYKVEAKKLTDNIAKWEAALKKDLPNLKAEEYKKNIRDAKRKLEDMSAEISKELGKKQEDNLVALWKDVQDGIAAYANQKGIEVVFGYGDPMEKELLDQFPNVNRKMQAMDLGSTVPLFVSPRAEIGEGVAELLNRQYRESRKNPPKAPPIDVD